MTGRGHANWYPDPLGRFESRYWNGAVWTAHVATRGVQGVDAPISAPGATLTRVHAGWHPDPFGRFESRYWDGTAWTEHVSIQGRQHVDAPQAGGAERQQLTMGPSAGVNTAPG